jgi:steroid 5-alpha reductase family enzyme
MNLALIGWNAVALFLYMSAVFVLAYRCKKLNTVDIAWGGGFVVAAWLVAGLELSWRTVLIGILIDIWAIRITNHLANRVLKNKEDDPRYVAISSKWDHKTYWLRAYISVFLLQGLLILVISLPTVFATGDSLGWAIPLAVIGSVVWLKGFVIETLADRQLAVFIADKKNKGKVLDTGLWKRTRHPNYLGEITQWYGIGIIACGASWGWVGLIGPVTLNVLIRFISGVPPIENTKRSDPAYQKYMQRTHAILPNLARVPR